MRIRIPAAAHVSPEHLRAFAAGESGESDHREVAAHVASCARCRERVVALVADHDRTTHRLTPPPLRTDALARIVARRERGVHVLLPHGDAGTRRNGGRMWGYAAAAAALLLGVTTVLLPSRELAATDVSGDLRFTPLRPAPGDTVLVTYHGARFGGDGELRLRALLRTAQDEEPEWAARYTTVTTLHRGRDDVHRGAFVLPDSAVYGAFAVENAAGSEVDTRGGRLWDLLVHDRTGRPLFAAMRQRIRFHAGRDQQVSLQTARALATEYPDDPRSWQLRMWYDATLLGAAGRDSVIARYRPPFLALDRRLRALPDVSPHHAEAMWLYASQLGEDSAAVYWSRWLVGRHPRSPEGALQRYFALPSRTPPAQRDALLDRLWTELRPAGSENVAFNGFLGAREESDTARLRKWGVRLESIGPPWYNRSFVGYTMARTRGLEAEGAARLRAQLREFEPAGDRHRIVGESVLQYRQRLDGMRAAALVALGDALEALGRLDAARDTLRQATALAWNPAAYLKLGAVELQRGDVAAARAAAAYAFADGSVPAEADSLRRRSGASSDDAWHALVAEGRALQRRQLLATSMDRPLAARARIQDPAGREHELADVIRGSPAVVAFWSRYCIGSLEQLPELQRAVAQLAPRGVRVVAITAEMPSPALTAWLREKGYTFEVYHDARHEAATVLEPWGTPDNLVVDARGRLRFRRVNAADVVGRVEVIRR